MRSTSALIAFAVLGTTLVGCSAVAQPGCAPAISSGDASRIVSASGEVGEAPDVEFPTPLVTESSELTTLAAGDGPVLREGDIADLQLSVFLGDSGELLTASDYDEAAPIRRRVGDPDDVFARAAECLAVGSRAALTTTVAGVYGEGQLDPALGLEDDDTLVVVIDATRRYLGRADGANQLAQDGLPAVVTAPDGRPGISIPAEDPPTELRISTLKLGDGPAVEEGDTAVVAYTGVLWDTGAVFDSSWERPGSTPSSFAATSLEDGEGGLVPGFAEALIGSTVGSQVLVVIPPEEGYPEGQNPPAIPAGSTMIFVFDVLGIQ